MVFDSQLSECYCTHTLRSIPTAEPPQTVRRYGIELDGSGKQKRRLKYYVRSSIYWVTR